MRKIFGSASRLVFLILTCTACYGFIRGILPTDQFMLLATGAFSFYFAKRELPDDISVSSVTTTSKNVDKPGISETTVI